MFLRSYEERHVAHALSLKLSVTSPERERFEAKTTVLIANVEHHIEKQDWHWFRKVRVGLAVSI